MNNDNTSPLIIKRTAIDSVGCLGWLYDCCTDQILEPYNITPEKISNQYHQKGYCILKKGNQNQNRNPLELIDIDAQLRLSLLLHLTSQNGIGKAINYPNPIDEYTRIFYYSYIHREEQFLDDLKKFQEYFETDTSETNATHIITGISWGIDIIIILKLPSDDNIILRIDDTLEKYRASLNSDRNDFQLTENDIHLFKNIISTKVYSNIPELTLIIALHIILHNITRLKIDDTQHQRLFYTLYPISNSNYIPFNLSNNIQFEQYLYKLLISMNILANYFNKDIGNLLCGHFKQRCINVYKQWSNIKIEYMNIIKQFSDLIIEIRCGINQTLTFDKKSMILKTTIDDLTENVIDLIEKGYLINDLRQYQIQYYNAIERFVDKNDNVDILKRKLMIDEYSDRILCSNDLLNKTNPLKFKELCESLVDELKNNSKLRLFYADFSYCSFQLINMIILSSKKTSKKKEKSKYNEILSSTKLNHSTLTLTKIPSPTPSSSSKIINILLLGETGVGKSTFINAFINYLTFKTLNQAELNKPIVAIPISFLMTIGDDFEERLIKFGDLNNLIDEDFSHPGQSVTQRCKSYLYNLNNNNNKKLRIIDTPGFGDTRGLEQDNLNLEHILDYIKKLKYLNAICFLLKPNETRLNIYFRSCFIQLFNLLGLDIHHNIIFCFTNTRSTFYKPGNTGPLLKEMLSSFTNHKILFEESNTFCFDSESFRYIMALQNQIQFNDHDKHEYEISWKYSEIEANRLIRYIFKKLIPCSIPDEIEIIKNAQIEIIHMIHPILEAMRYILRNIIINKINSMIVSNGSHSIDDISLNEIENDDQNHQHFPCQTIPIKFLQDYKLMNDSLSQKQDDMINELSLLYHISVEFSYFLVHIAHSRQSDLFSMGLSRLITKESNTYENQNQNDINLQLVEGLTKLANDYQQRMQILQSNPKCNTLPDIFKSIKYMREHPLISKYMIENSRTNFEDDNDSAYF